MKRYVLGKVMAVLALMPIVLSAKSTKTDLLYSDVFYELVPSGDIFDPLDWVQTEPHNCPGTGHLCGIDIFNNDVYTLSEATAAGNPSWAHHPKVNVFGTQFTNDLVTAAASSTDNQIINGRTYFKRNIP